MNRDLLCSLEGFDIKAIRTVELPENLPKKWQHVGPQTKQLYTPEKSKDFHFEESEMRKPEKTHVMMFKERVKMEFSPTKVNMTHSP